MMSKCMSQAYLSELAKEPWMMNPADLTALFSRVSGHEATMGFAAIENSRNSTLQSDMMISGDTATISVTGTLMKSVPAFFKFFGIDATGYDAIRNDIAIALGDPKIKNIVLDVQSPGGQVAGIDAVVDDLKRLSAEKNVTACVGDLCASAAYLIASQADTIEANRSATVGSIGVYMVMLDFSKQAEEIGIKVHVIKSGEFKGTGVAGAEITAKQIEPIQEIIDGLASHFVASVADGRKTGIANIQLLATGRMWLAAEAKELGLIDTVISNDNSDGQIEPSANSNIKDQVMSDEQSEKLIDTAKAEKEKEVMGKFDQMLAAFPDNQEFAITQFQAGASLDEAKIAFADVLAKENADLKVSVEAKDKEIADAKATVTVPKVEGADAVTASGTESAEGSESGFREQARVLAKDKGITVSDAMRLVAQSDPESHAKFRANCPAAKKPRRSK